MGTNLTLWFKIVVLGLLIAASVSAGIRRLPKYRKRIIGRAIALSKDKRDKLFATKRHKIMFILAPIYLLILPYLLYGIGLSREFIYWIIGMLILACLLMLEDYMFSKDLLKEIQQREMKELNSVSQDP